MHDGRGLPLCAARALLGLLFLAGTASATADPTAPTTIGMLDLGSDGRVVQRSFASFAPQSREDLAGPDSRAWGFYQAFFDVEATVPVGGPIRLGARLPWSVGSETLGSEEEGVYPWTATQLGNVSLQVAGVHAVGDGGWRLGWALRAYLPTHAGDYAGIVYLFDPIAPAVGLYTRRSDHAYGGIDGRFAAGYASDVWFFETELVLGGVISGKPPSPHGFPYGFISVAGGARVLPWLVELVELRNVPATLIPLFVPTFYLAVLSETRFEIGPVVLAVDFGWGFVERVIVGTEIGVAF
jgi:hypothetical protein